MEKFEEAVKAYRELLKVDGANAEAHNNLGLIYLQQGRSREAVNELAQAVRYKADYAEAHYNFGLVLRKGGDVARSNAELEQAYRLAPQLRTASPHP